MGGPPQKKSLLLSFIWLGRIGPADGAATADGSNLVGGWVSESSEHTERPHVGVVDGMAGRRTSGEREGPQ